MLDNRKIKKSCMDVNYFPQKSMLLCSSKDIRLIFRKGSCHSLPLRSSLLSAAGSAVLTRHPAALLPVFAPGVAAVDEKF